MAVGVLSLLQLLPYESPITVMDTSCCRQHQNDVLYVADHRMGLVRPQPTMFHIFQVGPPRLLHQCLTLIYSLKASLPFTLTLIMSSV